MGYGPKEIGPNQKGAAAPKLVDIKRDVADDKTVRLCHNIGGDKHSWPMHQRGEGRGARRAGRVRQEQLCSPLHRVVPRAGTMAIHKDVSRRAVINKVRCKGIVDAQRVRH